jgi:hypothetical protein
MASVLVSSGLSLRAVGRLASAISLGGSTLYGGLGFSIACYNYLGSSVSLRRTARGFDDAGLSVIGVTDISSAISVRATVRAGSGMSIFGLSNIGSVCGMSCVSNLYLGSSLSLRGLNRCSDSLSVLDMMSLGESASIRKQFIQDQCSLSLLNLACLGSCVSVR